MTLHRFFVPAAALAEGRVAFPDAVAYQIRRVLRMRPGDQVLVLDGSGLEYLVELTDVGALVSGHIRHAEQNAGETSRPIVLYQGILKAAKFETVVQHCTETGVSRIVPLQTARSVASEPSPGRQRRFDVIAREAAEQSGRGMIPIVGPAQQFTEAITRALDSGPAFLIYEGETDTRLIRVEMDVAPAAPVSLFVGPEGGFEPTEATTAIQLGARTVSLGPRILRAETAAIVACALVAARLDGPM